MINMEVELQEKYDKVEKCIEKLFKKSPNKKMPLFL